MCCVSLGNRDYEFVMLAHWQLRWRPANAPVDRRRARTRLCLYVHDIDAAREWAYDRQANIDRLNKGLDEANAKGWTVVSMKNDWKTVFPSERK